MSIYGNDLLMQYWVQQQQTQLPNIPRNGLVVYAPLDKNVSKVPTGQDFVFDSTIGVFSTIGGVPCLSKSVTTNSVFPGIVRGVRGIFSTGDYTMGCWYCFSRQQSTSFGQFLNPRSNPLGHYSALFGRTPRATGGSSGYSVYDFDAGESKAVTRVYFAQSNNAWTFYLAVKNDDKYRCIINNSNSITSTSSDISIEEEWTDFAFLGNNQGPYCGVRNAFAYNRVLSDEEMTIVFTNTNPTTP